MRRIGLAAVMVTAMLATPASAEVVISGSPVEGETLAVSWTEEGPPFAYWWERCPALGLCGDLPAGEGDWDTVAGPGDVPTYALTAADVGSFIRGVMTFGDATPQVSPRVGPIAPAAAPPPVDALPPPRVHETANLDPVEGVVFVREPGSAGFRRLEMAEQVPLGSAVDATHGEVAVVTARNESGTVQTGWFWAGAFVLDQERGDRPVTELELARPFGGERASAAARRRGGGRRLWGRGRCKCRTEGRNSSATVRGTKWLTIDRRRRTITRVKRGSVRVRDFAAGRTVTVRAGASYTARRR